MTIENFKRESIQYEKSGATVLEFYRLLKIAEKAFNRNADANEIMGSLRLCSPGMIDECLCDTERIFNDNGIDIKEIII